MLLQPSYDSKNTPDMKRRGLLIRNEITGYFRDRLPALKSFVPSVDDLTVHGKDGMGPKNEIPYVRIHSKRLSPRPPEGWYVCLLFEALGNEAYLVLAHGSTKNAGSDVGVPEFVEREPHEIAQLMSWATNRLGSRLDGIEGLTSTIQMRARRSPLGPAYEKTSLRVFVTPLVRYRMTMYSWPTSNPCSIFSMFSTKQRTLILLCQARYQTKLPKH